MREQWGIGFCNQLDEETHGEANRHGGGARIQAEKKKTAKNSALDFVETGKMVKEKKRREKQRKENKRKMDEKTAKNGEKMAKRK